MFEMMLESCWSVVRYIRKRDVELGAIVFGVLMMLILLVTTACYETSDNLEEAIQDSTLVVQHLPAKDTLFTQADTLVVVHRDTTYVVSELMQLDSLAAALDVTSEFIWQSYLSHSVTEGFTSVLGLIVSITLLVISCKLFVWLLPKVDAAEKDKEETLYSLASLIVGLIVIVTLIGTLIFSFETVWGPSKIINKEYYALQNVLELVVPNEEE
jgi:hypothetical protein